MKKAQVEIMGLIIIVIILVFIAIFALSFIIKPKQANEDIIKVQANALRSSLLKTNLCKDVDVKDEIENCIDGYHSCMECDKLKIEIDKIIRSSLDNNYGYNLVIDNFINIDDGCISKINAVSQSLGNSKIEFGLCRR